MTSVVFSKTAAIFVVKGSIPSRTGPLYGGKMFVLCVMGRFFGLGILVPSLGIRIFSLAADVLRPKKAAASFGMTRLSLGTSLFGVAVVSRSPVAIFFRRRVAHLRERVAQL